MKFKSIEEWKRQSTTCQDCYGKGVAGADIKISKYKQALEEIREAIGENMVWQIL